VYYPSEISATRYFFCVVPPPAFVVVPVLAFVVPPPPPPPPQLARRVAETTSMSVISNIFFVPTNKMLLTGKTTPFYSVYSTCRTTGEYDNIEK
jgi:hypothetical protein